MALAPISSSAPVLVVLSAGFMPPRVLAVPAGTRLPAGVVRAVAVAVPVARAGGAGAVAAVPVPRAGGAGARLRVAARAAAEAGNTDSEDQETDNFFQKMEEEATRALKVLALLDPPADLVGQANELKAELEGAKKSAQARLSSKVELTLGLLQDIYGVVDLGEQYAARDKASRYIRYKPTKLFLHGHGKATLMVGTASFALHFRADDAQAMVDAVSYAVNKAAEATGRCAGPDGIYKDVLPLIDPEDW